MAGSPFFMRYQEEMLRIDSTQINLGAKVGKARAIKEFRQCPYDNNALCTYNLNDKCFKHYLDNRHLFYDAFATDFQVNYMAYKILKKEFIKL